MIDWTPIEVDYRIGKMSMKAIAAKHGVAYSGVRKKVIDEGWTQDLTPMVQAATRAELTKQSRERAEKAKAEKMAEQAAKKAEQAEKSQEQARQKVIQQEESKPSDADVVAASSSEDVATITSAIDAAVIENVAVINRHRNMADALMRLVGTLAAEVKTLTDDEQDPDKRRESLGDRVDAVRKLSQTVATVVDVERKAHNLDEKAGSEDSLAEFIRSLQGSSLPIVHHDPEADEE